MLGLVRRFGRSRAGRAAVLLVLYGGAPAFGQVLVVEPGCAEAGDTILVTGSGWAEPNPVCEYRFFLDGATFIPPQPDGLFGPPNRSGEIPAGTAAGDHTVKVELRLSSDGTLLQCRQRKIKVVTQVKDPWTVTNAGGLGIIAEFDPTDVCDVTPCTKIAFVQTIQMTGQKSDGTFRNLTFAEQGFGSAATFDADVTAAGWTVDYVMPAADPYYPFSMHGQQGTPVKKATMEDGPRRTDAAYPPDIVKIVLNFEVEAFCAAGTNKGEFLGMTTWRWERPKGGAVSSTILSMNRDQPSADLISSLNTWAANHGFTLPTKTPPTSGGEPCN